MKFVGVTVSSLAALAAMSLAANAADLGSIKDDVDAPPPPSVSWSGMYITGGLGGSYMFTDLEGGAAAFQDNNGLNVGGVDRDFLLAAIGAQGDAGASAFFGTVGAGLDFQVSPRWVVGILGDYDFGSEQDVSVSGAGGIGLIGAAGVTVTAEMGDTWSIGGRLGYLINPRTLVYAMGGYSEAEFELTGTLAGTTQSDGPFGPYGIGSGKSWRQGYFVGGGLETMLAENISAKLEYRYSQFDGETLNVSQNFDLGGADPEGVIDGVASMSDPEVHSVRAALSVRFNAFGH